MSSHTTDRRQRVSASAAGVIDGAMDGLTKLPASEPHNPRTFRKIAKRWSISFTKCC